MEQLITQILLAALIGLFSVTYRDTISNEEILNWWFRFGSRFEGNWFWKPIWGCHLCISGQIALWIYAVNWITSAIHMGYNTTNYTIGWLIPIHRDWDFSVLNGMIFIAAAIGFAYQIYKKQ